MSEPRTRDYLLEISRSRANQWLPDDSKFPEPDPEEDEEDEEPEPELELKKLKPKPKPKGRKVPLPRQSRSTPSVLSEQHRSSSRHASPFREKQSHPRGLNYRPDNQQRKRDRFPRMPLQLSAAAEERLEQDANLEERRKFFGRIHYDDVSSELDGEFPWPWGSDDEMSPERLLGDQLEAFDDVRVDERVFVSVDRYRLVGVERQIVNIKVSGRREDRVQTALKRVEGAVQEIESNCSYTERALLLEPPLVEITGVRVDDRPSLIGEPCKRAPKELIGTVAAPLIDFGEPITMMGDADERRSQRAENADRRRDALKSSLIVVHAMRKHIRLRVQIGALQLLQYKTSDELKNGLHDWSRFCSMLSKLRARWRVAPEYVL